MADDAQRPNVVFVSGDDPERHYLEQENAELRVRVGALEHQVVNLRAAVLLWRQLYETATLRYADGVKGEL